MDLILRNARLAVEPGRLVDVGLAGRAIAVSVVKRGIQLSVVMTATDADVIKAYVELGLGIAVLPR